ncbi:hypothetical protein, partial [Aliiruegeria lutimaris]|uniref:hypothetical protein n=1 Tax=Aliiruegeria lutimaris TaxID=571298 RepID=UPI001BAF35EB
GAKTRVHLSGSGLCLWHDVEAGETLTLVATVPKLKPVPLVSPGKRAVCAIAPPLRSDRFAQVTALQVGAEADDFIPSI